MTSKYQPRVNACDMLQMLNSDRQRQKNISSSDGKRTRLQIDCVLHADRTGESFTDTAKNLMRRFALKPLFIASFAAHTKFHSLSQSQFFCPFLSQFSEWILGTISFPSGNTFDFLKYIHNFHATGMNSLLVTISYSKTGDRCPSESVQRHLLKDRPKQITYCTTTQCLRSRILLIR